MKWEKLGLIFRPQHRLYWMQSHATLPTPLAVGGGLYRIYFASRDRANRSHVGYFDVDLNHPSQIREFSEEPILAPGPIGFFDDHGIYASCAVRNGHSVYLYTIGWNPGVRHPLFYASIGLAISEDQGRTYKKYRQVPIMSRSEYDPCMVTGPWVIKEGSRWRMWYVSGYGWEESEGQLKSFYHIKYAESNNGIDWLRQGQVAIDHARKEETNIARPCIVKGRDLYGAWFAHAAGSGYQIGFASSVDGKTFVRQDERAGIKLSGDEWENESIAHPAVVEYEDHFFMFYNGNQFGRDGVALAIAKR